MHPRATCVTVPGLARSLRRSVTPSDVQRLVSEMSPTDDNSKTDDGERREKNAPGLGRVNPVETPPRFKAEDGRSEDARL